MPCDKGQHRQSLAETGHRDVQWRFGPHSLHGQGEHYLMMKSFWTLLASGHHIQVSPASENGKNEHVICVYNPNYQDVAQVMRVENLLRSAGLTTDLLYKPDIFSALGIYRNNKWGFRATIYSSRVMLAEGRSKISIAVSEKFYHNSSKGFESPQDLDNEKVNSVVGIIIS